METLARRCGLCRDQHNSRYATIVSFVPEVVLCDIGLPGLDGYHVARALKSDDALKESLLVALSGYALPEDLEHAADAGFDRHLAKPPDLEALKGVLASAASHR
jgi:CheY-like chemotaxis protein